MNDSIVTVRKVERAGKVAVLYSPGFGAGWTTWNEEYGDEMLYCPELVEALERKASEFEVEEIAKRLFPKAYLGGLDGLSVKWVPKGQQFYIHEYDGSESVKTHGDDRWRTA